MRPEVASRSDVPSRGELEYWTRTDLLQLATDLGTSEGRPGWPPALLRKLASMREPALIDFIVRNAPRKP
jgi:hypothetical protein